MCKEDFAIRTCTIVGVSRQTINMIENDKYNPSLKLCINIAKTLGVTLNDLFWEVRMTKMMKLCK